MIKSIRRLYRELSPSLYPIRKIAEEADIDYMTIHRCIASDKSTPRQQEECLRALEKAYHHQNKILHGIKYQE